MRSCATAVGNYRGRLLGIVDPEDREQHLLSPTERVAVAGSRQREKSFERGGGIGQEAEGGCRPRLTSPVTRPALGTLLHETIASEARDGNEFAKFCCQHSNLHQLPGRRFCRPLRSSRRRARLRARVHAELVAKVYRTCTSLVTGGRIPPRLTTAQRGGPRSWSSRALLLMLCA